MSLWVDKHRPNSINKLDYNLEQAEHLKKLVATGDFPHLLVYGPSGAGKRTRITCLLRELYGNGIEKLKIEHQTFTSASGKKIEISSLSSNYHIEINPSDVGIYDKVVIQELLKTVAQTQQLDTTIQKEFKVVVINEADKLTKDAQHALRRTMEKYMVTCRLILNCISSTKIIAAIRSRCIGIRVAAPSMQQISQILISTCRKEGLTLPVELSKRIAIHSKGNLRVALLACEVCKVDQYPFTNDQAILTPDWETYLKETANMIVQQQSSKRMADVRARIYELLIHCIPAEVVIKGLLHELLQNCDGQLKRDVIQSAAFHEHRMQLGQKQVYHIEAFIAYFMATFKKFLEDGIHIGTEDFNDDAF